jgi:hypothetical protein
MPEPPTPGEPGSVVLKQAWLHGHALGRPLDTFHTLDLSLERLHGLGTALRPCTALRSLCLCNNRLANLHGTVDLALSLNSLWCVRLGNELPIKWHSRGTGKTKPPARVMAESRAVMCRAAVLHCFDVFAGVRQPSYQHSDPQIPFAPQVTLLISLHHPLLVCTGQDSTRRPFHSFLQLECPLCCPDRQAHQHMYKTRHICSLTR